MAADVGVARLPRNAARFGGAHKADSGADGPTVPPIAGVSTNRDGHPAEGRRRTSARIDRPRNVRTHVEPNNESLPPAQRRALLATQLNASPCIPEPEFKRARTVHMHDSTVPGTLIYDPAPDGNYARRHAPCRGSPIRQVMQCPSLQIPKRQYAGYARTGG